AWRLSASRRRRLSNRSTCARPTRDRRPTRPLRGDEAVMAAMTNDAQAQAVTVRPALAGDCREIARLHASAFPRAWDEAAFMQFLADPSCITLVACARGDLAGVVVARAAGGEADIFTLGVAPHAR